MTDRRGPLLGIRVLDLTSLYPGPFATMFLADLGAEVIRVEHPRRPDMIHWLPPFLGGESTAYLTLNRGKRSLGLDLSDPEGRGVFFDLVETVDIVVEQFRPGVLKKMGLDYERARGRNGRIIYVSLTGFGQDGPYANRAGHDINYISLAGILSQVKSGGQPALPAFQMADVAGGAYMTVIACLAALWHRQKTGSGQSVDVSMLDAALPLLTLQLAQFWGQAAGEAAPNLLDGTFPCYGVYRCADGKHVALGALEPKFWINFCKVVKREEWISGNFAAGEEGERIRREVETLFLERTAEEWMGLAETHDVCLTPVREMEGLAEDPHLRSRGMVLEIQQKGGARLRMLGTPLKFSESRLASPRPAPAVGEDSVGILRSVGYTPERIRELIEKGVVYAGDSKVGSKQ